MTVPRRSWLKWLAGGGVGAAAAALTARLGGASAPPGSPADGPHRHGVTPDPTPTGGAGRAATYGHGLEPPIGVTVADRLGLLVPPPATPPSARTFSLWVGEQPVALARDITMPALTYNGTIPGPILRCTEGDVITVQCRNLGAAPHTVHFHGRHGAQADGWEPVPPGGEGRYRFVAGPAGVHPYHCHVGHHDDHALAGMHGVLLVDPVRPRAPAHEFVLVLSGHPVADAPSPDGRAPLYTWNGVAGLFLREPIKVPAGALVRVYLVNACLTDPVASFHLHAATFDVYRTGTRMTPDDHTDVVTLGPMERAVLEFRLPQRGRYLFHPHQPWMAQRGATGWFAAV